MRLDGVQCQQMPANTARWAWTPEQHRLQSYCAALIEGHLHGGKFQRNQVKLDMRKWSERQWRARGGATWAKCKGWTGYEKCFEKRRTEGQQQTGIYGR